MNPGYSAPYGHVSGTVPQNGQFPHGFDFSNLPMFLPDGQAFSAMPDSFQPPFWPPGSFPMFPPPFPMPMMGGVQGNMPIMSAPSSNVNTSSASAPAIPGLNFISSGFSPSASAMAFVPNQNHNSHSYNSNIPSDRDQLAHLNSPSINRDPAASVAQPQQPKPESSPLKRSTAPTRPKQQPASEEDSSRENAAAFINLLILNGYTLADLLRETVWSNADKRKLSKLFNDVKSNRISVPPLDLVDAPVKPSTVARDATADVPATAAPLPRTMPIPSIAKPKPQQANCPAPASAAQSRQEYLERLKAAKAKASQKAIPQSDLKEGQVDSQTSGVTSTTPPSVPVLPICLPASPKPDPVPATVPGLILPDIAPLSVTDSARPTEPQNGPASSEEPPPPSGPSQEERKRIQTELARKRILALAAIKKSSSGHSSSVPIPLASTPSSSESDSHVSTDSSTCEVLGPVAVDTSAIQLPQPASTPTQTRQPGIAISTTPPSSKRPAGSDSELPQPKRSATALQPQFRQSSSLSLHFEEPFIIEVSDDDDSSEEGEVSESESPDTEPGVPSLSASPRRHLSAFAGSGLSPRHDSGLSRRQASTSACSVRSEPQLREMELRIAKLKRDIEMKEAEARAAASCSINKPEAVLSDTPTGSADATPASRTDNGSPDTQPSQGPAEAKLDLNVIPGLDKGGAAAVVELHPVSKHTLESPPEVRVDSEESDVSMDHSAGEDGDSSSGNSDTDDSDSGSDVASLDDDGDSASRQIRAEACRPQSVPSDTHRTPIPIPSSSDEGEVSDSHRTAVFDGASSASPGPVAPLALPIATAAPDPSRTIVARTYHNAHSVQSASSFTPYDSPLQLFKSFRFHSEFINSVQGGYRSLTFSNGFDPHVPLCPFDVAGICTDPRCQKGQHWKGATLTDEDLIVQLGAPNRQWPDDMKRHWNSALSKAIEYVSGQQVTNADLLLSYIVCFRRKFLGDNSRVVTA